MSSTSPERGSRTAWSGPDPGLLGLVGVLVVAVPALLYFGRDQWFYLDEWDFLAGRTLGDVDDVLGAHNEHWTTVPLVVYRLVWSAFGLHTYVPYQLLSIGIHLLVAVLLWMVLRRLELASWVATLMVVPFVFFGAGYQNIFWGFQITFTGALAAGLGHLLLADRAGRRFTRRDGVGLAVGAVGVMCSGVAVPMTLMVGVAVLVRRGWVMAVAHTVPLAAMYVLWWAAYGRDEFDSDWPGLASIVRFGGRLIGSGLDRITHVPFAAIVLAALVVAGLTAWGWAHRGDWRSTAGPTLGALAGMVALAAITGLGRAEFSELFAEASRYTYLVFALATPALGLAVAGLSQWRAHAGLIVVALLWLGLPANLQELADHTDERSAQLGRHELVLALPLVATADDPDDARPLWGEGFELTLGWLRQEVADGTVPGPDEVAASVEREAAFRLAVFPADEAAGSRCTVLAEPVVVPVEAGDRLGIDGGVMLVRDIEDGDATMRFGFVLPDQGGVLVVRADRELRLSGLQADRPSSLCDARAAE